MSRPQCDLELQRFVELEQRFPDLDGLGCDALCELLDEGLELEKIHLRWQSSESLPSFQGHSQHLVVLPPVASGVWLQPPYLHLLLPLVLQHPLRVAKLLWEILVDLISPALQPFEVHRAAQVHGLVWMLGPPEVQGKVHEVHRPCQRRHPLQDNPQQKSELEHRGSCRKEMLVEVRVVALASSLQGLP